MAKVIEKANGERIIVSDNVPEDIQYDEGALSDHLASVILKRYKSKEEEQSILNPIALLLTFEKEEYPVVPMHLTEMKRINNKIYVSGTMLTSDYAWMLEKDIQTIKLLTLNLEHRMFNLEYGAPYQIKSIAAKGINAVGVTLNLLLLRTT
jgi:hypothetical protein